MKINKSTLRLDTAAAILTIAAIVLPLLNPLVKSTTDNDPYKLLQHGLSYSKSDSAYKKLITLQRALNLFTLRGDSDGIFQATVHLCLLYDQVGEMQKSYNTIKQLKYREIIDNYSSQYWLRLQAYYAMAIEKNYAKSSKYSLQSIEFTRRYYPADTAILYVDILNRAELQMIQGQYHSAQHTLDSIAKLPFPAIRLYMSQYYYCLAKLHQHNNQTDSAYLDYLRSIDYAQRFRTTENMLNSFNYIIAIDSARNDIKAYIRHRNSIDSVNSEIKDDEVYYRTLIDTQQQQAKTIEQQYERRNIIILLSALFTIILSILIVVIVRHRQKSEQSKHQLLQLEKQKTDSELAIERMKMELLQLKVENTDQSLDSARRQNVAISLQLSENGIEPGTNRLATFEKVFRQTYSDFVERLETKYPNLTRGDIRLIAQIKTGMTSHEIAQSMNITIESLHKSRYRLRKKLNLPTGTDLDNYICSL